MARTLKKEDGVRQSLLLVPTILLFGLGFAFLLTAYSNYQPKRSPVPWSIEGDASVQMRSLQAQLSRDFPAKGILAAFIMTEESCSQIANDIVGYHDDAKAIADEQAVPFSSALILVGRHPDRLDRLSILLSLPMDSSMVALGALAPDLALYHGDTSLQHVAFIDLETGSVLTKALLTSLTPSEIRREVLVETMRRYQVRSSRPQASQFRPAGDTNALGRIEEERR